MQPGAAFFPAVGGANDVMGWINNLSGSTVLTESTGTFEDANLGTAFQRGSLGPQDPGKFYGDEVGVGFDPWGIFCASLEELGPGFFQKSEMPDYFKTYFTFFGGTFLQTLCREGDITEAIQAEACIEKEKQRVLIIILHAMLLIPVYQVAAAAALSMYEPLFAVTFSLCLGRAPSVTEVYDLIAGVNSSVGGDAMPPIQIPQEIEDLAAAGAATQELADQIAAANSSQEIGDLGGNSDLRGTPVITNQAIDRSSNLMSSGLDLVLHQQGSGYGDLGEVGEDIARTPPAVVEDYEEEMVEFPPGSGRWRRRDWVEEGLDPERGVVGEETETGEGPPPKAAGGGLLLPAAALLLLFGMG
jgi:hypothetical protein